MSHDPFVAMSFIAAHTTRIGVGVSVRDPFGEATYVRLTHLAHCLSIDLQESNVGFVVPIKGGLRRATGAVQDQGSGISACRAHS